MRFVSDITSLHTRLSRISNFGQFSAGERESQPTRGHSHLLSRAEQHSLEHLYLLMYVGRYYLLALFVPGLVHSSCHKSTTHQHSEAWLEHFCDFATEMVYCGGYAG